MYKIIMLQETDYMKIYFLFHKTDRKSINPDVLFYAGQAVGSRRERMRDWLQLFSLVQPYIIAGVCDSFWGKCLKGINQVSRL